MRERIINLTPRTTVSFNVFFSFGKFVDLPFHAFLVSLEYNKGKETLIERRQVTKHSTDSWWQCLLCNQAELKKRLFHLCDKEWVIQPLFWKIRSVFGESGKVFQFRYANKN